MRFDSIKTRLSERRRRDKGIRIVAPQISDLFAIICVITTWTPFIHENAVFGHRCTFCDSFQPISSGYRSQQALSSHLFPSSSIIQHKSTILKIHGIVHKQSHRKLINQTSFQSNIFWWRHELSRLSVSTLKPSAERDQLLANGRVYSNRGLKVLMEI